MRSPYFYCDVIAVSRTRPQLWVWLKAHVLAVLLSLVVVSHPRITYIPKHTHVFTIATENPIAPTPAFSPPTSPLSTGIARYIPAIRAAASRYHLPSALVAAVIRQESNFNPQARSQCGAMGLMQLMPKTAKSLGVRDLSDPAQNIEGGVHYLKTLLDRFKGNIDKALAAYNGGAARVIAHNGVPPVPETQSYVHKVRRYAQEFAQEPTLAQSDENEPCSLVPNILQQSWNDLNSVKDLSDDCPLGIF